MPLWLGFSIRFGGQKRAEKSFQMWIREIGVSKKMLFVYPDNDYCRLDLRGENLPTASFLTPLWDWDGFLFQMRRGDHLNSLIHRS